MTRFLDRWDALPTGGFTGVAHGRRYRVTRQDFAGGRSQKLIARAVDGSDYISANLYRLDAGARLRPCEMPEAKVVDFVMALIPEEGSCRG